MFVLLPLVCLPAPFLPKQNIWNSNKKDCAPFVEHLDPDYIVAVEFHEMNIETNIRNTFFILYRHSLIPALQQQKSTHYTEDKSQV